MIALEKYFNILEIEVGSNKEKIKKAYRCLAHKHHPDKGGDEVMMKKINEAYAILIDSSKIIQQPVVQQQWCYAFYYQYTYGQECTNADTTAFY